MGRKSLSADTLRAILANTRVREYDNDWLVRMQARKEIPSLERRLKVAEKREMKKNPRKRNPRATGYKGIRTGEHPNVPQDYIPFYRAGIAKHDAGKDYPVDNGSQSRKWERAGWLWAAGQDVAKEMNRKYGTPLKNPRKRNPVENKTHALKAITVKYLGATNFKPSRYRAFDSDNNSVTISTDHGLEAYGNAAKAAEALQEKMGWGGTLVGGHTKDGWVFTFRSETFRGLPRAGQVKKNPRKRAIKSRRKNPDYPDIENAREYVEARQIWERAEKDLGPGAVTSQLVDLLCDNRPDWTLNKCKRIAKELRDRFPHGLSRIVKRRQNPDAYVIALHRNGSRLTYNALRNRFITDSEHKPALYRTQIAAQDKAEILLRQNGGKLSHYRMTVEPARGDEAGAVFGARPRQRNPDSDGWYVWGRSTSVAWFKTKAEAEAEAKRMNYRGGQHYTVRSAARETRPKT